ncbi:MAG TPA: hypothetical protein VHQ47_07205 [Phycisphaerae bacterium]|jgi:hypothetical protein|nr:hypothetical protein [Phycisphaerae bacterium]
MTTVDEIKAAIDRLSFEERAEIARYFHGWTDDEWDEQIKQDVDSGKLDALLKQVDDDIREGRLEDGP